MRKIKSGKNVSQISEMSQELRQKGHVLSLAMVDHDTEHLKETHVQQLGRHSNILVHKLNRVIKVLTYHQGKKTSADSREQLRCRWN